MARRYVTTNLRFPEATYRELQYQAARRGTSLASVVRESVDRYLGRDARATGEDPLDRWVGAVASAAGDESVQHDHYLYGWPKEDDRETPRGHERDARPGPRRRHASSRGGGVRAGEPEDAVRSHGSDPRRDGDPASGPVRRRPRRRLRR